MSDVKALPENMEEIKQDSEYKRLYKKHTIDDLELQLMEANVDFLSADDKPDLVWRLLDAQGYNFKTGEYADTNNQDNTNQADSASDVDGHTNGGDANAADSNSGNNDSSDTAESVTPTDKGNSDETMETMETNDTPAQGEDAANSDNDSGQDSAASNPPANSASNGDSQKDNKVADTTVTNAPSDDINSDDDSANKANEPAKADDKPAADSSASDNEASAETAVNEREYIEVKSKASFNMLEPATGTLVKAGKTTKIYVDARTTKEQILRNIAQYNQTRGNNLTVTN